MKNLKLSNKEKTNLKRKKIKKILSITILLSLFINLLSLPSFANPNDNNQEELQKKIQQLKEEINIEKQRSNNFQELYKEQKRINDARNIDAENDRKELLKLQRNEDARKNREEQRKIQQLEDEKEKKDREEQLQLQKFKSEEIRKKIEAANFKIDKTFAQIIKANPCMKAALEEINSVVYSADPDEVRKTIFKLESEKESLENYKKSLITDSKKQLENINNRLQAINYELDILNNYQKSNNEYDKKIAELNDKIDYYNQKIKDNENYLNKKIDEYNQKAKECDEKVTNSRSWSHFNLCLSLSFYIAGFLAIALKFS